MKGHAFIHSGKWEGHDFFRKKFLKYPDPPPPPPIKTYLPLVRGRECHFIMGKRADSLDTTLFRLPLFMLPFFPTSSGRHFAGFPVAIKTPGICVNFAIINEIICLELVQELFQNSYPG